MLLAFGFCPNLLQDVLDEVESALVNGGGGGAARDPFFSQVASNPFDMSVPIPFLI